MGVVPVDARCPALGHSGGGQPPGAKAGVVHRPAVAVGLTRPRGGPSRTPSMRTHHSSHTSSAAGRDNRKQNNSGRSDPGIKDSDIRLDRLEAQKQQILDALEKGNGPKNHPPSDAKPQQATRFTVQQEVEESANPDFPELLKTIFQYIQLTHHYENWSEIPDSLNKAIDILIANIRPPLPGDGVNSKLKDPGDDFKTAILVATQAHLHSRAVNAEAELSQGRWTFVTGKRPPVRPRSTTTDV